MRYNPYNWEVRPMNKECRVLYEDLRKQELETHDCEIKCIIDELSLVCNELDLLKIKSHEINEKIVSLEQKKAHLINKLY